MCKRGRAIQKSAHHMFGSDSEYIAFTRCCYITERLTTWEADIFTVSLLC